MSESGTYDEATLARQKIATSLLGGVLKPEENVKHWAQGLANMAKAGIGGYIGYQGNEEARQQREQGQADLKEGIAAILAAQGGSVPTAAAPDAAPAAAAAPPSPPVKMASLAPTADVAPPAAPPAAPPRVPVEPMGDVVRTNPDGSIAGNITAPTIPAPTGAAKVAQVLAAPPAAQDAALPPNAAPTAGQQPPAPPNIALISRLLHSPNKEVGAAMLSKLTDPKTVQSLGEGWIWKNGKVERAYTPEDKNTTDIINHKHYLESFVPTAENPKPLTFEQYSDKAARAKAQQVNISGNEPAIDKAIGEAKGKVVASAIEGGVDAGKRLRTLSTLAEANRSGGDDISSGPLGKAVLTGKQALSELTGKNYDGLAESEVTQKVGFDLATKMVKAISSRPTQMEFGKALENVPGIFMSKPGREAMLSILSQDAQAERDLGRLANKYNAKSDGSWQEVADKYYEEHPLISPFTGKPFGDADIKMLSSQPGAGAAPAAAAGPNPDALAEARKRGLIK